MNRNSCAGRAARVAAIRLLQEEAATDVGRHFEIAEDGSFTIDTAALVASVPA